MAEQGQQPAGGLTTTQQLLIRFFTPPTPEAQKQFTVVGAVLAFLGVLLVIFSTLSWASADYEVHSFAGQGGGSASVSVSGLGSVSTEGIDVDTDSVEEGTSAPGVWTIIFGLLLIGASLPLLIGSLKKYFPWGLVASVLVGFALLITASVFFADPAGAVGDSSGDTEGVGAGYGLWIVFLASLAAFVTAVGGLFLLLRPQPAAQAGWQQPPAPAA
ncbi:hypothetical protein QSJ18_14250 [Gordonia sp. ABSL1-1]|uniref:hypothetical protein n=1 Tax=Gordonia sp. ABSL1-1 TaxID=3053923 RepID=UPI002573EF5F|nr:hypothetical protein [Gordonia sp. ABSL1-1]MDL9937911.1 hypothetical protein [Gordonia sp. ABSL1-1]